MGTKTSIFQAQIGHDYYVSRLSSYTFLHRGWRMCVSSMLPHPNKKHTEALSKNRAVSL